jgi:SAM-dependent methyltransferase
VNPLQVAGEGRGVSFALRRICAIPALRALAIQFAAMPPALAAVWLLARLGAAPGYVHAAALQGLFAAALTRWAGMARWWRLIQCCFPLAVLGASALALPPALFLGGFVLLLLLYWSTFRTQVPYYPSGRPVRKAVAGLLPAGGGARFIDIGSGFGGLVLSLARLRPDAQAAGIELAPLPWLASRLRAALGGSAARFVRGDYEQLDFGQYDLVYAYLSPAAMDALWRKAEREMRPGSRLVSYEFVMTERAPDQVLVPGGSSRKLYVWQF